MPSSTVDITGNHTIAVGLDICGTEPAPSRSVGKVGNWGTRRFDVTDKVPAARPQLISLDFSRVRRSRAGSYKTAVKSQLGRFPVVRQ